MRRRGVTTGITKYAESLGIPRRSIERMGGMERVQAMNEDARAVMVNQVKNLMAKRSGKPGEAAE